MYRIFQVLRLIGVVFGTASVVQTVNKIFPIWTFTPYIGETFNGILFK